MVGGYIVKEQVSIPCSAWIIKTWKESLWLPSIVRNLFRTGFFIIAKLMEGIWKAMAKNSCIVFSQFLAEEVHKSFLELLPLSLLWAGVKVVKSCILTIPFLYRKALGRSPCVSVCSLWLTHPLHLTPGSFCTKGNCMNSENNFCAFKKKLV